MPIYRIFYLIVLNLGWLKMTGTTESDTIQKQGLVYCYLVTHNHKHRMWCRRKFSPVTYKAVWLRMTEKQRQTEKEGQVQDALFKDTFRQASLLQTRSV